MWGIYFRTWLRGQFIGQDYWKNRYYRLKNSTSVWNKESRWVLYHGTPEASKVPPPWNAWLRRERQYPPLQKEQRYAEHPYLPNLTGTRLAFYDFKKIPPFFRAPSYQAWMPPSSAQQERTTL